MHALREIAPLTGDGKITDQNAVQASYYGKQCFKAKFAENLKTMVNLKSIIVKLWNLSKTITLCWSW